jgi:nucleoside-diphosphate-sugar epimerase
MSILVTGATSQVGYFLLPRLQAARLPVVALSRHTQKPTDGVTWWQGHLPEIPVTTQLRGVISLAPLENLALWLSRHEVQPAARLVATSSMSVLTKRHSTEVSEQLTVESLEKGEAGVIRECTRLGIAWTLIRPTLIYGAGIDKSLTLVAHKAARWRVFPLPAGRGWRQPLHADDLAQALLLALACEEVSGKVLEIGGGERLSAQDMFERVRKSLPVKTMPLRLGPKLLSFLPRFLPRFRGPLSRLNEDLIADNADVRTLLGLSPRVFRLDAAGLGFGAPPPRTGAP